MKAKTVIATPAADIIIILNKPNPTRARARVHVNSIVLRNASEKFNALLGSAVNNQKLQDDTKELPGVHMSVEQVPAMTAMLRFLHDDYDKSELLSCSTIRDLTILADDYSLLPSLGGRLRSLITLKLFSTNSMQDLCYLLLAAYTARADSAFRDISAKMVRDGRESSFYGLFNKYYYMGEVEVKVCIMLQAKRAQINAKISEQLLPILQPLHKCACIANPICIRLILGQVHLCMEVKDGRTPQEGMDQLQQARELLGGLEGTGSQACSPQSSKECLLRHAQLCLAQTIQDIRQLSHEGLSLADVDREQAK